MHGSLPEVVIQTCFGVIIVGLASTELTFIHVSNTLSRCVRIKTGRLDIVNNCIRLMPALTKLNAQYFSAFDLLSREHLTLYHHAQLWPPNSPDLNPVDHHIWSVLEQRVYRTCIRDVNHLMTRLVEEWQMFDHRIIDWAIKQ